MFSHLHLHTEYSLLNGATRIPEAIQKAKDLGMPALAITDYGNIFGAVEFFIEAKKAGIKPVLGTVLFLPNYDDHRKKTFKRGEDVYWQILLLVKNKTGYQNLSKLLTQAYLEGFYYKPRVDKQLLREHSEGLIALSSGFNSEINHHLFAERRELAVQAAKEYAEIFPGNFFVELQDNDLPGQKEMNLELMQIAREVGLPVVATNNVHYLKQDDAEAFEILRAIQVGRTVAGPYDSIQYSTPEYYFKSAEEMQSWFSFCPEALENTQKIVELCNFEFEFGRYYLPQYETPHGKTLDDFMGEQAVTGFVDSWGDIKKISKVTDADRNHYEQRLYEEIAMIQKMGFAGYFLIVSDFIKWAKSQNIPVGPGRGSGAGSLVAYCLKITDLDPLPYNLLFERFLNPERVSMPDFDIDFCQDRRGEVIEYVTKKYGNVSQIITFGKMKARAVLRDVGRVMGLPYEDVDRIAKLVPTALNIKLSDALTDEPELKQLYTSDDTIHKLIDVSLRLEGLSRHASVHAAGVIITDRPLWEMVPLYSGSREDIVVQFDMKSAEKIGLIKFDFLGLKTLTVIHKAVENIKKTSGTFVDITKIPMDDSKVYEQLSHGDGCGIFQLESSGMRDLMKRLQPNCFEDIIALVALYRPGPLGSGMVDDFIERKKGKKEITYDFKELEVILKDTYGVIVYQEQVMQISSALANYSLGEADLLRRAMGKKKASEMAAQRKRFLEGSEKNKHHPEKAGKVFDLMAKFAEYGFNKSHSAAYALISYQTAWLKTHYPTEYLAAVMSTELEDTDKILIFIKDCKRHGIKILPPDVNISESEFMCAGDKTIRYGLGALKGMGSAAIESIIETRKTGGAFNSFYDFCTRVDLRRVSKKVLEVLIKSGALDGFGVPRKSLFHAIENVVGLALKQQKNRESGQNDLFFEMDSSAQTPTGIVFDKNNQWSKNESLAFEKEVFGFYFSGHPLESYADSLKKLTTHHTQNLSRVRGDESAIVGGTILTSRTLITKKGEKMAFAELEDLSGKVELVIFPRAHKKYGMLLTSEEPLIIKGSVDHTDGNDKIMVDEIVKLTEKLKKTTRSIHLNIAYQDFTQARAERALEILGKYQGASQVYFHLKKDNYEAVIQFPHEYNVMACEPLQYQLNQLFQGDVVTFT